MPYAKVPQEDDTEEMRIDGSTRTHSNSASMKTVPTLIFMSLMGFVVVISTIDQFTMRHLEHQSDFLNSLSFQDPPWSLPIFVMAIVGIMMACLPSGPLVALFGARCYSQFGGAGLCLGGAALSLVTVLGASACFVLGRHISKPTSNDKVRSSFFYF